MTSKHSYVGTDGIGKVIIREITATFVGDTRDEIHVERSDGKVSIALTPVEALAMVTADDRAIGRKRSRTVITRLTWENVPAKFEPPSQHRGARNEAKS